VRIASGGANASLPHVAYRTPQGKHVLVVSNTADEQRTVDIRFDGEEASATLPAGAVASYVW
jgi:glucosylceramidase